VAYFFGHPVFIVLYIIMKPCLKSPDYNAMYKIFLYKPWEPKKSRVTSCTATANVIACNSEVKCCLYFNCCL